MARKKKSLPPAAPIPAAARMPQEAGTGLVALILCLAMFLSPALGVPTEEMLQDTLKSIIVSFGALGAALAFFWSTRNGAGRLRWHWAVVLPVALMLYALGSIAWSHRALASVEAIRWFIFSLLMWLALNTFSRERLPQLALAIHAGGFVASVWAVLQFLVDFKLFPQGPHPASTFVNRNFFAEFAVCTLPFAALLLARARQSSVAALLAFSSGLTMAAILMTGTRAALIALWLQLLLVLPVMAWLYRERLEFARWPRATQAIAGGVLVATVLVLGSIPTGDPTIPPEGRGLTGLERGFKRTGSISTNDESLGIRMIMWKATMHMIGQRPLSGVGAGAWENDIPLYQAEGAQLETDYYVHNEFLQLIAEYGLVGWAFLIGLLAWLVDAFRRTLSDKSEEARAEAPWRAMLLTSLLALFIVSNVGFAWRMASTGALFALSLGCLAASDARLGARAWRAQAVAWRPRWATAGSALSVLAIALAAYITQQAAECERKIVRATKIALTISASGSPNDPRWDASKREMLQLLHEGIAINPHYRKITPIAADELAQWGDWRDAIPIWESVLSSRPHIVAIESNVARGYLMLGNNQKAAEYLARAKQLQPHAPTVRSLEVLILARSGQEAQALAAGREAIERRQFDFDLLTAVFVLARRAGDFPLAARAMELRIANWQARSVQGLLDLGAMYVTDAKDPERAVEVYRRAAAAVPETERPRLLEQVPAELRPRVAAQISASKG